MILFIKEKKKKLKRENFSKKKNTLSIEMEEDDWNICENKKDGESVDNSIQAVSNGIHNFYKKKRKKNKFDIILLFLITS